MNPHLVENDVEQKAHNSKHFLVMQVQQNPFADAFVVSISVSLLLIVFLFRLEINSSFNQQHMDLARLIF